jgi:hypothetical protein
MRPASMSHTAGIRVSTESSALAGGSAPTQSTQVARVRKRSVTLKAVLCRGRKRPARSGIAPPLPAAWLSGPEGADENRRTHRLIGRNPRPAAGHGR